MKHTFLTTTTVALMAMGSYAQAQDLKMSHVRPQDATIDVELRAFAEAVAEATDGEVKVDLFPASALGDYTTVQERISVGAIDMRHSRPPSRLTAGCRSVPSRILQGTGIRPARSMAPAARCATS